MKKVIKIAILIIMSLLILSTVIFIIVQYKTPAYSSGLDDDGIYKNMKKYSFSLPDFSKIKMTDSEILSYGASLIGTRSIDEYFNLFAGQTLSAIGPGYINVPARNGDIVVATINFIDEKGEELVSKQFVEHPFYIGGIDNDLGDEIRNSFIGHLNGDKYSVQYTFPKDDEDYPNKTVTANIQINFINTMDKIDSDYFNLSTSLISHYYGTTEKDDFKALMKARLIEYSLKLYIEDYVKSYEMDVPEEFVNYEITRIKEKLVSAGYDFDNYVSEIGEDKIKESAKINAISNIIYMNVYLNSPNKITDDMMIKVYGELNVDDYKKLHGNGYLKLRMIRGIAIDEICSSILAEVR